MEMKGKKKKKEETSFSLGSIVFSICWSNRLFVVSILLQLLQTQARKLREHNTCTHITIIYLEHHAKVPDVT